jgi:hypothetical protein
MKKLLVVSMLFASFVSYAQDEEVVPDLKPYEDASSKLFISKVIEVPNKTQKELATQFKNWASTSFVNLKEVMVSETDNQIVINYITETPTYMRTLGMRTPLNYSWYVRFIAQFKDGKMKVSFFDDGNVFIPGHVNSYSPPTPATPARNMFISAVTIKPESVKKMHNSYFFYDCHYKWQENVVAMLNNCENGVKNNTLVAKLKDDF